MKSTAQYAVANESKNTLFADLPDNKHDLDRMKSETVIMDLPEVKDIPGQEHIRVMPLGELADTTISSADEEGAGILDFDAGAAGDDDASNTVVIDAQENDDFDDDELDDDDDADILGDDLPEDDRDDDDLIVENDDADFDDEEIDDDDDDIAVSRAGNEAVAGTNLAGSFDESAKEYREAKEAEITEDDLLLIENAGLVEKDSDTDALNRSRLDNTDFDGELLNEASSTKKATGSDLDVPGADLDDADEALGEEDEENNVYSMADAE